jgi:two-component system NtrC family response regulator
MSAKARPLLIVEDDPALQKQICWAFDQYETLPAIDRESAVSQLRRHSPPVVTMDLGLPPDPDAVTEGFKLLEQILELAPDTKVIVLTGQNDRANAVRAIGCGAYDFFAKPFEPELLVTTIMRFACTILRENRRFRKRGSRMHSAGADARSRTARICRVIEKVAGTARLCFCSAKAERARSCWRALCTTCCRGATSARRHQFGPDNLLARALRLRKGSVYRGSAADDRQIGPPTAHPDAGRSATSLTQARSCARRSGSSSGGGRDEIEIDASSARRTRPKGADQGAREISTIGWRRSSSIFRRFARGTAMPRPWHAFVQRFAAEQRRRSMTLRYDAVASIEAPPGTRELENCIRRDHGGRQPDQCWPMSVSARGRGRSRRAQPPRVRKTRSARSSRCCRA